MRNTTAATAKTGEDACYNFKSPGNDSLVRLLPRRAAHHNCLLYFPFEIAGFIFIFEALGRGSGTLEGGGIAERGKRGQGQRLQTKTHSEEGDKARMKKESK